MGIGASMSTTRSTPAWVVTSNPRLDCSCVHITTVFWIRSRHALAELLSKLDKMESKDRSNES